MLCQEYGCADPFITPSPFPAFPGPLAWVCTPARPGDGSCTSRLRHRAQKSERVANITISDDFTLLKILTAGVSDKQPPGRAVVPGNISPAKRRRISPLPEPAENQKAWQPPLCRHPVDGSRFVPGRQYLRVPADKRRRNAAWCAGGLRGQMQSAAPPRKYTVVAGQPEDKHFGGMEFLKGIGLEYVWISNKIAD